MKRCKLKYIVAQASTPERKELFLKGMLFGKSRAV